MAAHAKIFSPSASKRILACPASVIPPEFPRDGSSAAAEAGTRMHEAAEQAYLLGVQAKDVLDDLDEAAIVQEYLDWIADFESLNGISGKTELPVELERLTRETGAVGTADYVAESADLLCIADLKTGRTPVAAFENTQLGTYAAALLNDLYLGKKPLPKNVMLAIIQPPVGKPKEWIVPVAEFLAWYQPICDEVRRVVNVCEREAYSELLHLPGESQCQYCPRKLECEARREAVLEAVESDKGNLEMLGELRGKVKFIRDFCDDVETAVAENLAAGKVVPGWKLVQGRPGNRKYTPEAEKFLEALDKANNGKYSARTFKSITQLEKMVKAKEMPQVDFEILEGFTTRAPGGPTVAHESDPRPVFGAAADSEFDNL